MTDDMEEEPRYIRAVVTTGDAGTGTVRLQWLRADEIETRRTSRWLWAFFVFILLGTSGALYLLLHPQSAEPIARAGEWLYGRLP